MTPTSAADALTAPAEQSLGVPLPAETPPGEMPIAPCAAQVIRNHRAILGMTAEIFPGSTVEVEGAVDPEIEGDPYLVLNVATAGEIPALVEKNSQWHRQLRVVAPETASSYRLSLDVR
jgi:hypothetical protein